METQLLEIMERYSDLIFRIALHNTGNHADAEDILQEVLLKCYENKKLSTCDGTYLKSWLIRVTINQCKDLHKSAWRKKHILSEPSDMPLISPKQTQKISEEYMDIQDALKKLTVEERTMIYLDYLGYKNWEIAELLHIKLNSVNTKLQRARKRLQDYVR